MRSSDVTAGNTIYASDVNKLRDDAYASSWFLAHEQTSPDLTLKVEEGKMYFGNTLVEYAGGNSTSFTAPATNPRIDILSIDNTGTLVRTAGTEAGSPTAPNLPAGNFPIAQIYNRVGQTSIKDTDDSTNGYIQKDLRKFLSIPKTQTLSIFSFKDTTATSSTRFDITNPSGTTFRYTYDGTGTNPTINATTFPIGSRVYINSTNINDSNEGVFTVTGSGSNYFEVTNASGIAENDKLIGSGSLKIQLTTWTKPVGLKYVIVETVGGGGGGSGAFNSNTANDGGTSSFGSHLSATGGKGGVRTSDYVLGGTGSNGDVNLDGQYGFHSYDNTGVGGASVLGRSGGRGGSVTSSNSSDNGSTGGGGGGYSKKIILESLLNSTETVTVGEGGNKGDGNDDGENGNFGIVIVNEFY